MGNASLRAAWKQHVFFSRGWLGWLTPILLPCSVFFCVLVLLRRNLYQRGWVASCRVSAPTISVGNLTVGGVGKTPVVHWLARCLRQAGARPGIVLRGYHRKGNRPVVVQPETVAPGMTFDAGDEAMLAAMIHETPVAVCRNRMQGAMRLVDDCDADAVLMDDGYQHLALQRDVDLVVVDGQNPLGNEYVLPYGPLREPVSAFRWCDAVLVHGDRIPEVVRETEKPVFTGRLAWERIVPWSTWVARGNVEHSIDSGECILLSGIGSPERMERDAREQGFSIVFHHDFPDHHWFTLDDLAPLIPKARYFPILTTEKDAVRLMSLDLPDDLKNALHVIQAQWIMQDEAGFVHWLKTHLARKNRWPWSSA